MTMKMTAPSCSEVNISGEGYNQFSHNKADIILMVYCIELIVDLV